ncbi:flagellar protein FlaG [Kiloniella majae]|uniref:flagellar protein FlaG n=1 Tax=Kiloniella majae TaxID=1938558 RepID=UPI000A278BDA|nr:flagellar protein FlaG [Kiloniella majae]
MSEVTISGQPTQLVPKVSASSSSVPKLSSVNASDAQAVINVPQNIETKTAQSPNASVEHQPVLNGAVDTTAAATSQLSSNIVTYRDSESGRLVVRLIDENNNAVISEFPSKTMLGNYPKQSSFLSSTNVNLDTEA